MAPDADPHDPRKSTDFETHEELADELLKMMETRGWKILMEIAKAEKHGALQELATVDPFDSQKIMKLQSEIGHYAWLLRTPEEILNDVLGHASEAEALGDFDQYGEA